MAEGNGLPESDAKATYERLSRMPERLPSPDDWLSMGYVFMDSAGMMLLNVRQIVSLDPGILAAGPAGTTGAVTTTSGVRFVTRLWPSFLADVVLALAHVYPRPWHPD